MKTVVIVGGGAAGLMAAYSASLNKQARVLLLEKNHKLGRKLMITGKGRCNLTNIADIKEFMENIPSNPRFLYSAFSQFSNQDLIALLEGNGLATKTERGGRVFPVSDRAADVVDVLEKMVRGQGVSICCDAAVMAIERDAAGKFHLRIAGRDPIAADALVLATGGLSYPMTGSSGDGYGWATALGHEVTPLFPSLVALKTKETFVSRLSGLSLKNAAIVIRDTAGKKIYEDFGEMLFTHFGVSGPMMLSASARIAKRVADEAFSLLIDLKPALDEKALDARILRDFEKYGNRDFANALDELLPKTLIPIMIEQTEISPRKKVRDITKAERRRLLQLIKAFPLTICGSDGYNHAVITCGGVAVSELHPKTMASKLVPGLYLAGELLDVDAYTGGFNLQIAFSTGYVAGMNAVGAE